MWTHMGTAFFVEGKKIFFRCTWVKNGYRGGYVISCCSLGVGAGFLHIKENNCSLLNKK